MTLLTLILITLVLSSCSSTEIDKSMIGRFDTDTDLFFAHFDSKTDVDDIHSIAGVATMLADPRFEEVNYHAVAGAYGIQEGLYVPANGIFDEAFGEHWSDAHANFDSALVEVSAIAWQTLIRGGNLWIADAGQSDFSAALVRNLKAEMSDLDLKNMIHVVQHADWNEEVTTPEDLEYLKAEITYHKIPDGNAVGNGTPGFRSDEIIDWESRIKNERLKRIWGAAIDTANIYNGVDGRYLNTSIESGGLDFSDVAETCWIFGFEDLSDANDFFEEFKTMSDTLSDAELVSLLDEVWRREQLPIRRRDSLGKVHGYESPEFNEQNEIYHRNHDINEKLILDLLDTQGWPDGDVIGYQGNHTISNVLQHSSMEVRVNYLPLMKQAVKDGDLEPRFLARAEDRLATDRGELQIYGGQIKFYPETNSFNVWPIVDPANVDQRRAEIGLAPIAGFLSNLRNPIEWDLEEQIKRTEEFEKRKKTESDKN